MSLFGSPDDWVDLIDSLIPQILELIVKTWATMPGLAADAREDPTTETFCRRLRQNRNAQELPFRIDIQMVELEPGNGEDQGRMDIAFSPLVPREDIYFCLECKRLNAATAGGFRSYATEYVDHGMLRFIRGQYASMVRNGGMVAYVLDGDLEGALEKVKAVVVRRQLDLGMTAPAEMRPSSSIPGIPSLKETRHVRKSESRNFLIHHLFVSGLGDPGHPRPTDS